MHNIVMNNAIIYKQKKFSEKSGTVLHFYKSLWCLDNWHKKDSWILKTVSTFNMLYHYRLYNLLIAPLSLMKELRIKKLYTMFILLWGNFNLTDPLKELISSDLTIKILTGFPNVWLALRLEKRHTYYLFFKF